MEEMEMLEKGPKARATGGIAGWDRDYAGN
jgi:hypothetical protein